MTGVTLLGEKYLEDQISSLNIQRIVQMPQQLYILWVYLEVQFRDQVNRGQYGVGKRLQKKKEKKKEYFYVWPSEGWG